MLHIIVCQEVRELPGEQVKKLESCLRVNCGPLSLTNVSGSPQATVALHSLLIVDVDDIGQTSIYLENESAKARNTLESLNAK